MSRPKAGKEGRFLPLQALAFLVHAGRRCEEDNSRGGYFAYTYRIHYVVQWFLGESTATKARKGGHGLAASLSSRKEKLKKLCIIYAAPPPPLTMQDKWAKCVARDKEEGGRGEGRT